MYIGSTGERGLHHLIWEIVDNGVDEALAGYATRIELTLQSDGGVRVVDNGRGIPTDKEPKTGLPGVEVVATKLHAGGKFSSDAYKMSGGLHGIGVSGGIAIGHVHLMSSTSLEVDLRASIPARGSS